MSKSKSVVNTKDYKYKAAKFRDVSGRMRYTMDNDDAVARAMRAHVAGGGKINQIVADNDLKVKKGSNAGLFRMSVGMSLRSKVRGGETVKIGRIRVSSLKQRVAVSGGNGRRRRSAPAEAQAAV